VTDNLRVEPNHVYVIPPNIKLENRKRPMPVVVIDHDEQTPVE
jgi:chemotaxis response regulator CheB